ncbi:hypothetical protein OF117_20655 [Geodermatophilus sp. YIM 151500]|uniref:hypothetical protein n=1 Tax=Geodermatophilus sp. YIM 151500 TaxID=2984531 RepID=UPI0021E4DD0D|nr:hypothetical protein [Geodermatophilus sp. YIM 151500]MCV2491761.1 hypothetical protein [Geodermatophilus sp. YIM 151500]
MRQGRQVRITAARVAGHLRQHLLTQVPPLRALEDHRRAQRVEAFGPRMPRLAPGHGPVLAGLEEHGAVAVPLDDLDLPGTAEMKEAATALRLELAAQPGDGGHTVGLPRERVLEHPAVWQWGLTEPLLDLVENYLGLPAAYHGAAIRCERATGRAVGVRQWHRDVEDHRMLKLLVWLDDVDEHTGPFEYVDRRHTARLTRALHYVSGYVDDGRIEQLVPRTEWRRGVGPRWTCVIADPRNVFHRAMPPTRRDRYSLTFSYLSRSPIRVMPGPPVTARERELATRGLEPRQLTCLPRQYGRVAHHPLPRRSAEPAAPRG